MIWTFWSSRCRWSREWTGARPPQSLSAIRIPRRKSRNCFLQNRPRRPVDMRRPSPWRRSLQMSLCLKNQNRSLKSRNRSLKRSNRDPRTRVEGPGRIRMCLRKPKPVPNPGNDRPRGKMPNLITTRILRTCRRPRDNEQPKPKEPIQQRQRRQRLPPKLKATRSASADVSARIQAQTLERPPSQRFNVARLCPDREVLCLSVGTPT